MRQPTTCDHHTQCVTAVMLSVSLTGKPCSLAQAPFEQCWCCAHWMSAFLLRHGPFLQCIGFLGCRPIYIKAYLADLSCYQDLSRYQDLCALLLASPAFALPTGLRQQHFASCLSSAFRQTDNTQQKIRKRAQRHDVGIFNF